jgi:ATP synthase protein I
MAPAPEPAWRSFGELASVGVAMVLSTIIGLGGGYALDRWLGTLPWFTLIGLGLGIVASFVTLFRTVRSVERRMDDAD